MADTRKAFSQQELLVEGGPLAQLIPEGAVYDTPKPGLAQYVQGEANTSGQTGVSEDTGEYIENKTANVYDSDISTGFHEGLHLLKSRKWHRNAQGKLKLAPQIPGSEEHHGDHMWMAGNDLFDARTQEEVDESKKRHDYEGEYFNEVAGQYANADMAGQEHDLGAKLMFDPTRGHGAEAVVASSMAADAFLDPRYNYSQYRNAQSYLMNQLGKFNMERAAKEEAEIMNMATVSM